MILNLTTRVLAGPTIPVGPAAPPPGTAGGFSTLLGWLTYLAYALCLAGLVWCGATLGMSHRRGGDMGEHGGRLAAVAAGSIIIGAAPTIIGAL